MSIITIPQEITSVGIPCYGLVNGVPNCGELSPGDQAIVDAIVACNGKNYTTAERTALWALLNSTQQDDYTKVRDDEIRRLWLNLLEETDHKMFWVLYIYKAGDKQSMIDDFEDNIEGVYPLWSDT